VVVPWPHPGRNVGEAGCETAVQWWDVAHELGAYVWASQLEKGWARAKPERRHELEGMLSLYSVRQIVPAESCWGSRRQLSPGDTMVQYLILWHAPLDVVYDRSGRVQMIYTSYE
jgi:hypothetical protein